MRINAFTFADKETNWEIERISFKSLTLLVGASGVGKTRILKSLIGLKNIAKGRSLNGVSWAVEFTIGLNSYQWEGLFDYHERGFFSSIAEEEADETSTTDKPTVLHEKITLGETVLAERKETQLTFQGVRSPVPIRAEQSMLALIPDESIKLIERSFRAIFYSDYTNSADGPRQMQLLDDKMFNKYKTVETIRNSDEDLLTKLYWTYRKDKKTFNRIKDDFTAVFPQVENLKLEPLESLKETEAPFFLKAAPFIQFRESGNSNWIPVMGMSAGMYRTLIHIMELHLSAEGTVILIDEFENSLGVNCIDELTTEMKGAVGRIQFIITSHHPYIINSISTANWKIVTREGGRVRAQDAETFNIGRSKHEAFIQLLNLPAYTTGHV